MEDFTIHFSSKVGLQNIQTGKYLHVDSKTLQFTVSGKHPFMKLKNNDEVVPVSEEFTIVNQQNLNSTAPLVFGSPVCLIANNGMYVVSLSSGELRLENAPFEDNSNSFNKIAKWTIIDATNAANRGAVYSYDEVVLKSPFGQYLIQDNGKGMATGMNVNRETMWKINKSSVPYMPDWAILRPLISDNYLVQRHDGPQGNKTLQFGRDFRSLTDERKENLGGMNSMYQEYNLIEDILFCMMGIEGTYIKKVQGSKAKNFEYAIEPNLESSGCDPSIRQLVAKILPICQYHDKLNAFINVHSLFEYGLVSQALCSALKILIREYILLINQLDNEFSKGELNLQKLWFYVQPSLRIMENLMRIVEETNNLRGGALVSALYKLMKSATDQQTLQVYQFLLNKAFMPFCEMLSKWVYHGIIDDTYEEFLIKERKDLTKDNISTDYKDLYWEKRFTIREDQIPTFLNKVSDQILFTGKYLNVIRECGKKVEFPYADELSKNYELYMEILDFSDPLGKAYEWANQNLINLVLVEEQLMARLKSIKHYFFMDQSDFFVHFLDSADEELAKGVKSVSKEKIESLLEMSVRTSVTNNDPFKEDLTCDLYNYTLIEQLFAIQNLAGGEAMGSLGEKRNLFTPASGIKGIEAFTLDYKVRWPLNLILSKKALTKYQIIFRHLFNCKYIERQLCQTWLIHQSTRELKLQKSINSSYLLTQKMLHFAKNLVYYLVYEVLEQKWLKFEQAMNNVANFDEILVLHRNFLDECLRESLLMDQNLLKILSKINRTCLIFSTSIQNLTENMKVNRQVNLETEEVESVTKRKMRIEQESEATRKVIREHSYLNTIQKFAENFNTYIRDFMSQINQQLTKFDPHLTNLLSRLDYNDFYSKSFGYHGQDAGMGGMGSMTGGMSGGMSNMGGGNMGNFGNMGSMMGGNRQQFG